MEMTSREILDSVDRALEEAARRLESGEPDGSGRYDTDEELAAGTATGKARAESRPYRAPAA